MLTALMDQLIERLSNHDLLQSRAFSIAMKRIDGNAFGGYVTFLLSFWVDQKKLTFCTGSRRAASSTRRARTRL